MTPSNGQKWFIISEYMKPNVDILDINIGFSFPVAHSAASTADSAGLLSELPTAKPVDCRQGSVFRGKTGRNSGDVEE